MSENKLLYFREYSPLNKLTLLLLHGMFGNGLNLSGIADAFKDTFRVIAPDLRNHGASFHSDRMDYDTMAEDVRHLLSQLDVQPNVIVGHSMGGKILMTGLLRSIPEFIGALPIVLDIYPNTSPNTGLREIAAAMTELVPEQFAGRAQIADALKQTLSGSDMLIRFLMTNITGTDHLMWKNNPGAILENIHLMTGFPDTRRVFSGPTYLVYGKLSPYLTSGSLSDMSRLFPGTVFTAVENTGHFLHIEQKQKVNEVLTEIVNRNISL